MNDRRTFQTIAEDSYESEMAMRDDSDVHTRALREQAVRAQTDPSLQCHHGVSVFANCDPCALEVGDPAPGPTAWSMAGILGVS